MSFKLINHRKENEKEFKSRSEAEDKKQDMISLGVDSTDLEIVATTGADSSAKADGGAEVVEAQPTETDLPDRDLSNDPIEWLRRGHDEFVVNIKGTDVITKKGFRVLQHKYDITTGSDVIVGPEETDMEFCRVKAWAEMPDGRRAEAHASAHVDRGDDHYLLVSMADTRAKSRALSDITGVGAVAVEEMQGVDE